MYFIYKRNGNINVPNHKEFVCYDSSDFDDLKERVETGIENCAPCSICFVHPNDYYMLSDCGDWIKFAKSSGSSGGSGDGGSATDTPVVEERPSAFGGDVRFYDYDGHQLYSYKAAKFLMMTKMPALQDHSAEGLVSQGWNYTIDEAKDYVRKYGILDVGSIYDTIGGTTRIYATLDPDKASPYVGVALNGTATIDWGDGTETEISGTSTTSAVKTKHDYATGGNYVIEIKLNTGIASIVGKSTDGSLLLCGDGDTLYQNSYYANAVTCVNVGSSFSVGMYAFKNLNNMKTVTLHSGVDLQPYAFAKCKGVEYIAVPRSSVSLGTGVFQECSKLKTISVHSTSSIPSSFATYCESLTRFCIPDGVGIICQNSFSYCYSLIGIKIPSSVYKIETSAFSSCFGLTNITFTSQTPPQASSSTVFSNLPTSCVIRVPAGTEYGYKTETNYPSQNSYKYEGV